MSQTQKEFGIGKTEFIVPAGVTTIDVIATRRIQTEALVGRAEAVSFLSRNGEQISIGYNQNGYLGDNTAVAKSVPVAIAGGLTFNQILCVYTVQFGNSNYYGLTTTGTLYSWGDNAKGGAGIGSITTGILIPTATSGNRKYSQLMNTENLAGFARAQTGELYYIGGNNTKGIGGVGDALARSSPTLVVGGYYFDRLISGGTIDTTPSMVGITVEGRLYSWGDNAQGQLGLGDTVARSSPTLIPGGRLFSKVVAFGGISPGRYLALEKDTGAIYAWGANSDRFLGFGDNLDRSSPTLLVAGKWLDIYGRATVGNAIAFIKNIDGVMYSWGNNFGGQLGQNISPLTSVSTPAAVVGLPANCDMHIKNIAQFATTTTGRLYAWGRNGDGQLGFGDNVDRSTATLHSTTGWEKIFPISFPDGATTFGMREGRLYGWGNNNSGLLGQNDVIARSTPTLITSYEYPRYYAASFATKKKVVPGQRLLVAVGNVPMVGSEVVAPEFVDLITISYTR